MMRKRKTVVAKRITPKVMTGIPKLFGILNDPLGNQVESRLMEKEEADQRKYDRFWGQDKDLQDRELERFVMSQEDDASLTNEKWYETVEIHKRWDEEYQRNLWFENRSQAKYKEIERREYLKFVNSSLSSDEVINFVWDRNSPSQFGSVDNTANKKSHVSSAQQQGLIFSDLSAINREVALSLPTTVGALHMSVHLDGLQQSRAIVDGASAAFKQTLRRINNQTALDGDAAQPFKTSALAAAIIKKKGQHQSLVEGQADSAEVIEVDPPKPLPAVEGHKLHKWDQELMLQLAFMGLDKGGKGFLTTEEVSAVSFDAKTHALLSFTVFWANIKKRNWAFFQNMGNGQGGGIVMSEWLAAAHRLSLENEVPLRHVRTHDEHLNISGSNTLGKGAVRVESRGAGAANVFSGLPEREHRVSRLLQEGDCVWALHHGGVMWLPAVVRTIHHQPPVLGTNPAVGPEHGSTVTYSTYRYDLWFPLSQKELLKARSTMAARQLLALPSQQAQTQPVPPGAPGVCLPPKPLSDERKVCAYAFDLVDSGGDGIVQLQRLVQCLQSLEFSRVVATSLALSIIFHGGSHARDVSARQHNGSVKQQQETGKGGSKMSVAGTADIPSLLPVFMDTFSAPTPEPEEEEVEVEVDVEHDEQLSEVAQSLRISDTADAENSVTSSSEMKQGDDANGDSKERDVGIAFQSSSDSAGDIAGGAGGVPVSATEETLSQPTTKLSTAAGGKKIIKVKRLKAATGPAPPPAVDWISKLDFLEFCQAVADIKRYSVCS